MDMTNGATTVDLERIFPGDSEMASRMRAFDWATSGLGPPEYWTENLRVAVCLCLTSRFPLFLWWGGSLTMLYNDAYIPFLGKGKHPVMLGRSGREAWGEIWDTVGPLYDTVMATGNASWSEDLLMFFERNLPMEEVYVTFSYSPMLGEGNRVDGIFCVCTETTQKVIGPRRLETLRRLSVQATEARTVAAACQAATEALGENTPDIPFAAIYVVGESGKEALLTATVLPAGERHLPLSVSASDADTQSRWPLATALRTKRTVECPAIGVHDGRPHRGERPEPDTQALIIPISGAQDHLAGLLVVGVSPYRPLDSEYRTFFNLVAAHIATAIADAQAYEEEKRRAEALAEIDRVKTDFFSNVSHEFRTPLTLMLGPLESLRHETDPTQARAEVELIYRNSRRLLKLVNTLLDFSRIEAGRIDAVYESTDLAAYTADLASVFRSAIEKAGLELNLDCPPLPEPAYVDREMWEKIVLNILSNAFKFTFAGEIRVGLHQRGERIELTVADTGVGIPKAELPRLFERFHRVRNTRSRTHEGTGIGMALVRELARLHGGDVTAQSVEGRGTTFTVSLPKGRTHLPPERIKARRAQAATAPGTTPFVEEAWEWLPEEEALRGSSAAATAAERDENEGRRESSSGPRPTILFADDNADMRDYLRRLLAREYAVITVADGEAALTAVREHVPDLVLTDVMMPRLDGFGLLKELRRDPKTQTIPVILLSARACEEARVEGIAAGADDYLIKPFSARELLARVGGALALARVREQARHREEELQTEVVRVLESITDGFVACDRNWRITYVNAEAERIHKMSRGSLLGRDLREAFSAILGTSFEQSFRKAMEERIPVRFEGFYEPYGRWFEMDVYPVKDGGLAIYGRDVTERKRIEAEAEALRDDLTDDVAALNHLLSISMRVARMESNATLTDTLTEVLDAIIELHGADFGNVQLYDREADTLRIVVQRGFGQDFIEYFNDPAGVRMDNTARGRALQEAQRVIIEDVETAVGFAPLRAIAAASGFRAVQSTPLFGRDGAPLGVLSTHFRQPYRPSERDLTMTDLYTQLAAAVIERKQAEDALRRSEERFRRYFDLGLIGMAITAPDKRCMEVNDHLCQILGYEREELLRMNWAQMTHPEDLPADGEQFDRVMAGEIDGYVLDKRWFRKDGQVIETTISVKCLRREDRSVEYFVALVEDTTERKRMVEALRESDKRQVQLAERSRMAREIHDVLAESFTGILMQLGGAERLMPSDPARAWTQLHEIRDLARNGLAEARRSVQALRPQILERMDLGEALASMIAQLETDPALQLSFSLNGAARELPSHVSHQLLRIGQEALTNAVRHAEARRIHMELTFTDTEVRLSVEDDGRGFDPLIKARTEGFGLSGIRERADILGADLTLTSGAGQGTQVAVVCQIPAH